MHDSIQTYLTAVGLAEEDSSDYKTLPAPVDKPSVSAWNRSRVLLWAASASLFAGSGSEILPTGGSELYQMCLLTLGTRESLRDWLFDEITRWASDYKENLRRKDVKEAIPTHLAPSIGNVPGPARLLEKAALASFDYDRQKGTLQSLGWIYAHMAAVVYEVASVEFEGGSTTDAHVDEPE